MSTVSTYTVKTIRMYVDTVHTNHKISNVLYAMYVGAVDTKHSHLSLSITSLIFNGFSIQKMFWKAKNQGFPNIPNPMYVDTVDASSKITNAFNAMYVDTVNTKHSHMFLFITSLIFNGFSIWKKFSKAENQGFNYIIKSHCWYCRCKL